MASVNFHPPMQRFPAGTTMTVFALPTPRPPELLRFVTGNPESWAAPVLTKVAAPVVAADGSLPVAIGSAAGELPQGKPGLCWANVAGEDRYMQIRQSGAGAAEPV
jgi:hypothetical protein